MTLSTRQNESQDLGIILKTAAYGDYDLIVSVLFAEFGSQRLFAKHARKSKKRFGTQMDLFHKLKFIYKSNSEGLWLLKKIEEIPQSQKFLYHDNLELYSYLNYLSEITLAFFQEFISSEEIFDLWNQILLSSNAINPARIFYDLLKFMKFAGYELHLESCLNCQKNSKKQEFLFVPQKGGVFCQTCFSEPYLEKESYLDLQFFNDEQNSNDNLKACLSLVYSKELYKMTKFIHQTLQKEPKSFTFFCDIFNLHHNSI